MPAKQIIEDDEEDEDEEENDEMKEEQFTCRLCGKVKDVDEGDDLINVCDKCMEPYDMEKFWTDYDAGKIADKDLKTISLEPYIDQKKAAKAAKKAAAKKATKKAAKKAGKKPAKKAAKKAAEEE
jgi:hypothetical protein